MSTTVTPTSRWISLTLTFPGVGSITRDRNIYKPVVCADDIATKLVEKFYAKYADTQASFSGEAETETDLDASKEPIPPVVPTLTPLQSAIAAINNCETVEELKELGLSAVKANAVLDAIPVDEALLTEAISAKTLAALVAKYA